MLSIGVCLSIPSNVAIAVDSEVAADLFVIGQRPSVPDSVEPTLVLDAEAITRSGATTLDEVLQRLPVFGFQGVNGNQNGGGFGATFVDLRNLNFNRTLVLINDRRVVLSGIQTDEAVDLANIPIGLVERIEILPYGTAPRYGADAVAGVVNIILKRVVSGASLSATTGISDHGDGAANEVSAIYGSGFEGGNVSIAASWMHRDALLQFDRASARDPIESASFAPDGRLILQRGSSATLAGNAIGSTGELGGAIDRYDPASASYLRPGLDRATVSALGHVAISDTLSAFLESSFSDRIALTRLPPEMLGLSGTTLHPDGFVVPASNPFNPYGQDVTLQRVLAEVGDQNTRTHHQLIRAVVGLQGTVLADTAWSLSLDHGDSRSTFSTQNAVNLTRALETVGTGCAVDSGCPVADYFGAGSLSSAASAYLRFTDVTRSRYLENVVQANLSPTIELARDRRLTTHIGLEYRTEQGQTTPDPVVLDGDQAGGDSAATRGGYNSREAFVDAALPIAKELPWAKSLTASAALRYVDTNLFGRFPVWKAGLSWLPVEHLLLHAGTGIARRVPAITEAFGGSTNTALAVTDPCDASNGQLTHPVVAANCRELGLAPDFHQTSALIPVANGGNAQLRPEYSRNVDVGLLFQPALASDWKFDVDYFKFIIHDAIDSLSDGDPNYIPDACLSSAHLSSPLCQMIIRVPSGPSAGQISLIRAPDQNIGAIDTDGVDLQASGEIAQLSSGKLSMNWHSTLLLDYRVQETPAAAFIQEAGTFPSLVGAGSLTRYKSTLTAQYATSRGSVEWTARYLGSARVLDADSHTPFGSAPSVFYHDASATLRLDPFTCQLGVDNLFGQRPPTLVDGISNTNLNSYDVVGRFVYLRLMARL